MAGFEKSKNKLPWMCCSVCYSEATSALLVSSPCAHFVCNTCRQRCRPNSCPACKRQPVSYEPASSASFSSLLEDVSVSVMTFQKVFNFQSNHYLQSCSREQEALARGLAGRREEEVSVGQLERAACQLENKILQMRKWKAANTALLGRGALALNYLRNTYSCV